MQKRNQAEHKVQASSSFTEKVTYSKLIKHTHTQFVNERTPANSAGEHITVMTWTLIRYTGHISPW